LNKLQQKARVSHGKQAVIHDNSMDDKYHDIDEDNTTAEGQKLGENAFLDLTDRKNDEFPYIY
jgi:hypothetical protein